MTKSERDTLINIRDRITTNPKEAIAKIDALLDLQYINEIKGGYLVRYGDEQKFFSENVYGIEAVNLAKAFRDSLIRF